MKLLTVPASSGVSWMLGGFRAFIKQPLAFAALFMTFVFGLRLLISLPGFGVLLALVLVPVSNVGFMLASEAVQAGRIPMPTLLVAALRGPRSQAVAMIQLGLAYALAALLAMWLLDLIDPEFYTTLQAFLKRADESTDPVLPDDGLAGSLMLRLVLPLPVTALFWHAPMIMHRSGVGVAKALFASLWACWRNRGAFAMYLLSWVALFMLAGSVAVGFFRLIGQPGLAVLPMAPLVLIFFTAFYASLHFTFEACFDFSADGPPA